MNLLLIGSGGREHALAWKLSQSDQVERIFVAPGNGGTATTAKCENVEIGVEDLLRLRHLTLEHHIDLTIVGPEVPLVAGLVDTFKEAGLRVFGPNQRAAQLEGSKVFSKAFMHRHGIPTAQAQVFTNYNDALLYVEELDHLPVIKADGLAAGKGVAVPLSWAEAKDALREMLVAHRFGQASQEILVEERLAGPEVSVLAFCDGESLRIMPPAQDYKRLHEGNHGPNTGGMGAFAPSSLVTPDLLAEVEQRVLRPALSGIAAEGASYVGVLYAGIILTEDGAKVLEFNCRFGDPETQAILPLLENDLVEVMLACVEGRLHEVEPQWRDEAAVTVVMAANGYPGEYETGKSIQGIAQAEENGCLVFHAGTKRAGGVVYTDGGRVLSMTAVGKSLADAVEKAYVGIEAVHFEGGVYRRDIGRT